jgi:hypothetical protein
VIYQLSGDCWFKGFSRAWLVLIRAECTCGYRTWPHLTAQGAGNAIFRHQVSTGTLIASLESEEPDAPAPE